jgi:uncharacterized membrane protein
MPLIKPRKPGKKGFPSWIGYIAVVVALASMDDIADHFGFRETWNSIKVVVFVIAIAGLAILLLLRLRGRRR